MTVQPKSLDHWQLQEAKNKFSRVVKKAQSKGPQFITVHGHETAVVLSIEDYASILRSKGSLVDFFQQSPLAEEDLIFERSDDEGRDIDL